MNLYKCIYHVIINWWFTKAVIYILTTFLLILYPTELWTLHYKFNLASLHFLVLVPVQIISPGHLSKGFRYNHSYIYVVVDILTTHNLNRLCCIHFKTLIVTPNLSQIVDICNSCYYTYFLFIPKNPNWHFQIQIILKSPIRHTFLMSWALDIFGSELTLL